MDSEQLCIITKRLIENAEKIAYGYAILSVKVHSGQIVSVSEEIAHTKREVLKCK
jgi:hypothetical protein